MPKHSKRFAELHGKVERTKFYTIDEAIKARETGEKKVILFNLCGHGMLDLPSYDAFLAGNLTD